MIIHKELLQKMKVIENFTDEAKKITKIQLILLSVIIKLKRHMLLNPLRYFILLLSLTVLNCTAQSTDCIKFRTGKFKYLNENPEDVIITRTDSTQIEANKKHNTKVISSVKWLSNCEFVVTPIKFINYPYEPKSKPIKVKIVETKNNSYTCIAVNDSISFIIKMIKIK